MPDIDITFKFSKENLNSTKVVVTLNLPDIEVIGCSKIKLVANDRKNKCQISLTLISG